MSYLKKAHERRVPPRKILFRKNYREQAENELDFAKPINTLALKSYYMNDGFAEAFSSNLKLNNNLNALILKNINLNDNNFE